MAGSMTAVDEICAIYEGQGSALYGGEQVTQLAHALQCAASAEAEGAPPALIAAALLHDIGHLIHKLGENAAERGVDDHHQLGGAKWLRRWFDESVTESIRLHVDAKRYLCAVEPGYFRTLSPASVRSLELQGGRFDEPGAAAFIALPHAADAVRLRRWDEAAKVPELATPDLRHYRRYLEMCLRG